MRSFIFDFNGTLYPDKELHRMAWKQFMAEHGILITDDDFEKHMYGPPNGAIVQHFMGSDLPQELVTRYAADKEAIYRQIAMADLSLQSLAPGACEMLEMMKQRGIPHAIATASPSDNVDFYFNTLGIGRWFDREHVFFDAVGLPGKPDPAIYLLAMEKLGYAPEDVTIVEDSMSGIMAAAAAGVSRVIAIDTTIGFEALSRLEQVDAVVHDFHNFERFIDE